MSAHGTFIHHVDDDQTDIIGIRTLVLGKTWVASRGDLTVAERDEEKPPVPAVPGGLIFIADQTRRHGGGLRTAWTFQGVHGNGKTVTFKDRDSSFDYRFDPGLENIPIQLHPDFIKMRDTYGGFVDGNEVIWPPTLSSGAAGAGLKGSGGSTGEVRNPLFGRQDYFSINGTYTFRYASFSLAKAESGVRRIHTTGQLPGKPPHFPGCDWLKAPTPFVGLGYVYDITEIYWLSPEGGWPKALYGGAAGRAGGPGAGLTTGGLTTGSL